MSDAKRSGRQARQAERSKKGTGLGRPFIMRNIPTYDVLSEENLVKIERAADRVLAETGIEFRDDPDSLQMWRKAGAKVDGLLVKFEPGMLREILKSAPATFTQHARNPAKSVEIGGKSVVFSPAYGSPCVMDLDRGAIQPQLPPFGRHDLRADRCGGEQAPSGYGFGPYDVVGQAIYGISHR